MHYTGIMLILLYEHDIFIDILNLYFRINPRRLRILNLVIVKHTYTYVTLVWSGCLLLSCFPTLCGNTFGIYFIAEVNIYIYLINKRDLATRYLHLSTNSGWYNETNDVDNVWKSRFRYLFASSDLWYIMLLLISILFPAHACVLMYAYFR